MQGNRHNFLCYSTKDRRFVDKLYTDLVARGIPIWLDRVELKAGDSLPDKIGSAISSADFFIAVISPYSVNSKWVTRELKIAHVIEVEEQKRFVIPIVRGQCTLPPFLLGSLYVSFQNSKTYDRNVEQLLRSLDREQPSHLIFSNEEPISNKKTTFIEDIHESLSEVDGDDDWVNQFGSLPLAQILAKALRLHSFGGQMQREIALALAMTSNAGGGIEFNNLVALLGFLKDAHDRNIKNKTYLHLLVSFVEDANIGTDYRWFAISWIFKSLEPIQARRLQLELLPDIFPARSFDTLADRLIVEFLSEKPGGKGKLERLWIAGSSYYREEIIAYVLRIGRWTRPPRLPPDVGTIKNIQLLWKTLRKEWAGLKTEHEEALAGEAESLKEALATEPPVADDIICHIEYISRARQGRLGVTGILMDTLFLSGGGIESIRDKHGDGVAFQIIASVISSPFTDIVLSLFALYFCTQHLGIDSLLYDRRFPGCLVVPKEGSLYSGLERSSLLGGLVESIVGDRDDNPAYLVLLQLLDIFPHAPLYAAVDMQISRVETMTPELANIRRIFSGDASVAELIADLKTEKDD